MSTLDTISRKQVSPTFQYLLNAMENAASVAGPFKVGYADKRKAVLEYVAKLELGQASREDRGEQIAALEKKISQLERELHDERMRALQSGDGECCDPSIG